MATAKPKTTKAAATPKKAASAPAPSHTNGVAVAALVVGIVALISGWAPFWGFLVGAAAIVLGIIGLKKSANGKGMSVAGIVMGAVGALWSLIVSFLFILSIAAIGLGSAATGIGLQEAAQQANESLAAYNAEAQAQINAKKEFKKGETATFGQFEVKINSVARNYEPEDSYVVADGGKEFIVLNVTVKNVGKEAKYISSFDLKVSNEGVASGSSYYDVDPSFDGGDLAPKASLTGNIMYEVKKDATGLKLQYETFVYDNDGSGLKNLTYTLEI